MSSTFSSTSHKLTPYQLPGFTLPLNFTPHEAYDDNVRIDGDLKHVHVPSQGEGVGMFTSALNDYDMNEGYASMPLTTLRELTMLHLMNHLTDKPQWETKVFDHHIAQKWKVEALATEGSDITQSMVDWIIEELQYKAKIFHETRAVSIYNGDVVKSDFAVPDTIKERLKAAVARLEKVPDKYKDFHPGSDGKVLDLVHPSLFPLVYGRSRILVDSLIGLDDCVEKCGGGTRLLVPPENEADLDGKQNQYKFGVWMRESMKPYSRKFQWLPCNVGFIDPDEGMKQEYKSQYSADGKNWSRLQCKITSYINNLHPQKHQELYEIIAAIITRAIPLWNMTLTPLKARYYHFNRIEYKDVEYDSDPETIPEEDRVRQEPGESEDDFWERRERQEADARRVVQPEPGVFQPPDVRDHMQEEYFEAGTKTLKAEKTVDLQRDFRKRGLQVIVKLANIQLTPEKPEYDGGTWHVEGQLNEHICATALYYYSSSNITTSRLSFRHQCSVDTIDIGYEQDQHEWLSKVFGCENESPGVQEIGDVVCTEGRLLTFPNILQHRVAPFRLADPSKEGHRKILALFLVDPNLRIISTANIPPQQREWWSEHVVATGSLPPLPTEIQDQVFSDIEDFPIGLEEAKELRLELMEERKKYQVVQGESFEANEFSLCEH